MNTPTESAESLNFERILKAIEAAKIHVAQAKIRVQLQRSAPEMVAFLIEYLDAITKLSSLENELLIMHLFEIRREMIEVKGAIATLQISAAMRL